MMYREPFSVQPLYTTIYCLHVFSDWVDLHHILGLAGTSTNGHTYPVVGSKSSLVLSAIKGYMNIYDGILILLQQLCYVWVYICVCSSNYLCSTLR